MLNVSLQGIRRWQHDQVKVTGRHKMHCFVLMGLKVLGKVKQGIEWGCRDMCNIWSSLGVLAVQQ